MEDCIFCKIAKSEAPSHKAWEDVKSKITAEIKKLANLQAHGSSSNCLSSKATNCYNAGGEKID